MASTETIERLEAQYRDALLDDVIPFWAEHSIDRECGGYITCLDRRGDVFDTDKFMWLQARQVWTFSMLYNRVEKRDEWLDIARHGAAFLRQHGTDADGNWYFILDRQGQPIPGLYGVGVDTGGWESETYCGTLSGTTFGFALNSGRIAAENAVQSIRPK